MPRNFQHESSIRANYINQEPEGVIKMKVNYSGRLRLYSLGIVALAGLTAGLSPQTMAGKANEITIIHVSDVHGHIRSHDEDFISAGNRENAGGVAKLATG